MDKNLSVVAGSLSDMAARSNSSIAEAFVNCDTVVLCDVSGSMGAHDSRDSKSRYQVALEELAALQRSLPGKIGIVAFSGYALFVPHGAPPLMGASTDLAGALRFAKVADVPDMRFFVISDGEPDDATEALAVASTYLNRIDTIFVGDETHPCGRAFLEQLAAASGGQSTTADRVQELASKVKALLLT